MPDAEVQVGCVYDLPRPIVVDREVLGSAVPTRLGDADAEVVTPRPVGDWFAVPELPTVPSDAPELADRQWVSASPAIDHGLELRRVGLVVRTRDGEAPAARAGAGASAPRRLIHEAFANVDSWFDRVRTWVEVLTGQDLDTGAPMYDAWFEGAGLRAWRPTTKGGSEVVDRSRVRLTYRADVPMPLGAWRFVLERAGTPAYPPIEHVLMRDARAALARNQSRRAVIDAGAAAELVLVEVADAAMTPLPEAVRAAATPRQRTLGTLVKFVRRAELELPVPAEDLEVVVQVRNAATHRVANPPYPEALNVINTVQKLVEAVRPVLPRP